jgi:hypothetical protein
MGQLRWELDNMPELGYNKDIIEQAQAYRNSLGMQNSGDVNKAAGYTVDGFGNFYEYLQTGYCEILEFEGSISNPDTGEYLQNVLITVLDRNKVLRVVPMPSYLGKTTKGHVGWRPRPDNCYAMGPLDNLVGMQYRLDHLENLKADAMDLAVHPPLVIQGNVESFTYAPQEEILVGEGGSITELGKNLAGVMAANNEIALLEQKMEQMAGAPREAMGIRTPGEKTAYEVQTLDQAASRIFQNKITHFEIELIDDALNKLLEIEVRNMDGAELVRIMDDDLGVVDFMEITKEDITAEGKLRAIGARHFASQATAIQNLTNFYNSAVGQDQSVRAHLSAKNIAKLFEEFLGLERFQLFGENIRIHEDAETQAVAQEAQRALQEADMTETDTPLPADIPQ